MKKNFAEKVIDFNRHLHYSGNLPEGFQVMNPYLDNPETMTVMQAFYLKYYSDFRQRKFIIGINPSRRGAGITGVPFTDTKRLESVCGIKMTSAHTHEISSVFMYDMIEASGGAEDLKSSHKTATHKNIKCVSFKWEAYEKIKIYRGSDRLYSQEAGSRDIGGGHLPRAWH